MEEIVNPMTFWIILVLSIIVGILGGAIIIKQIQLNRAIFAIIIILGFVAGILLHVLFIRQIESDYVSCISSEENLLGKIRGQQKYIYLCPKVGIVVIDEAQEGEE